MRLSSIYVPICFFAAIFAATTLSVDAQSAFIETVEIGASADATLIESSMGSRANGTGPAFFVGRTGQGPGESIRRGLISFDMRSAVPENARIVRAELILSLGPSNQRESTIEIRRVLQSWTEGPSWASGGSGAPAEAGDVTWIHRTFASDRWFFPGGDALPFASAVQDVSSPGLYTWSSPQLLADVQLWHRAPGRNFGWLIVGDEARRSTAKRFASRESGEVASPKLVVEFIPRVLVKVDH